MGEMVFVPDSALSCMTDGAIWAEASYDASGGAVVHLLLQAIFQTRDSDSSMQKG